MTQLNLTDKFCTDFIQILKDDLKEDKIDLDKISNHVNECPKCKTSLLLFIKEYLSAGNLIKILKGM